MSWNRLHVRVCLYLDKCLQARLHVQSQQTTVTHFLCGLTNTQNTHSLLSIHANTQFLRILNEIKKHTARLQQDNGGKQVTTATSVEGLCLYGMGGESEVLVLDGGGGVQEQLLHLIS